MKLSMWILADWLKNYSPVLYIKEGAATLRGVRIFSNEIIIEMAMYYSDFAKNQILSSDVQKANELVTTNMIVNFVSTGAGDTPIEMQNVVIGVKAKLYLILKKIRIELLITLFLFFS